MAEAGMTDDMMSQTMHNSITDEVSRKRDTAIVAATYSTTRMVASGQIYEYALKNTLACLNHTALFFPQGPSITAIINTVGHVTDIAMTRVLTDIEDIE